MTQIPDANDGPPAHIFADVSSPIAAAVEIDDVEVAGGGVMQVASNVSVHDDDASRMSRLSESSDSNSQLSHSYLTGKRDDVNRGKTAQYGAVVPLSGYSSLLL